MTADPQPRSGTISRIRARRRHCLSLAAGWFLLLFLAFTSIVIIQEGHVGIVKRWGKDVARLDPGFHLKYPVAGRIEEIEVRILDPKLLWRTS